MYGFGNFATEEKLREMTMRFQEEFPGDYCLKEGYVPESFQWGLIMVFRTPEDETFLN